MYNTTAFVLSRKERKEADYLVTLFTERYGRVSATAIGVRKPGAKLRGHLENFAKTDVHLVSGKSGYRLIGAILADPFRNITCSLERTRVAAVAARMVEVASYDGSPDTALWITLENFFSALNSPDTLSPIQCERILFWFSARFFHALGYQGSESDAHSAAVQKLFRLYEEASVATAVEVVFELSLHEAVRSSITRSFAEHLGTHVPIFAL